LTSKAVAFDENAVRTRAYLLWEADGRPFGRDDHYWGLALAEATAPATKPRRAAASAAVSEKKARPASKAKTAKAAAKPAKTKAPLAKGKKK
jgi:hypothetical protein